MAAFRDEFEPMLGTLIKEVVIGSGPCGELRYPSYSEASGWRYPGVGEFQCYDRHALSSLARAAADAGHADWGHGGPHNSGEYNNWPRDAAFFDPHDGSWETQYGHFFLQWYSDALLKHGRRLMTAANGIFASKLKRTPSGVKSTESLINVIKAWLTKTGGRLCRSPSTTSATDVLMSDSSVTATTTNSRTSMLRDTSLDSIKDTTASSTSLQSGIQSDLTTYAASDFGYSVFDVETQTYAQMKLSFDAQRPEDCGAAPSSRSSNNGDGLSSSGRRWDAGEFLRRFACFSKSETDTQITPSIQLGLKIAGVHWWYRTRSHAAELTAGYYNSGDRCGYESIVQLCREFNFGLTLTCVEMCDAQHPAENCCSPQALLDQIRRATAAAGVRLSGENALPIFYSGQDDVDEMGLDRIADNCHGVDSNGLQNNNALLQLPGMHSFTFLRLGPEIINYHRELWYRFMRRMHESYQTENYL